jgi:hypothetical protein
MRDRFVKMRDNLSEELVLTIRRDFETYLSVFAAAFDQLGTPCIIWERCNVIRYVNQVTLLVIHLLNLSHLLILLASITSYQQN